MARAKRERPPPIPTLVELESFVPPSLWTFNVFENFHEPRCFNGSVYVRRYRLRYELIDEPKEVVIARIRKLWDSSENYHDAEPLRTAAAELGVDTYADGWLSLGNKRR